MKNKDYPVNPLNGECVECNGTKKVLYSCCGDNIGGTEYEDYMICPTCHEHLGDEWEECECCKEE